jgi:hypothetical protein
MTKIIAIGGKKKSGKGLGATYLAGLILSSRGAIKDFKLNDKNDDHCIDVIAGKNVGKNIHINKINPTIVKLYGFADRLKEMCSSMFGVDIKLLYGDEKQKNTETHIKWSDMPGVITDKEFYKKLTGWEKRNHMKIGRIKFGELPKSIIYKKDSFMTVRELLQHFGTDICRKIFNSCWVDYLHKDVEIDAPEFAVITDMRFDNEFYSIKNKTGKKNLNIKLLRDPNSNSDLHYSEQGFSENLPWDIIVDNRAGSPQEMCKTLIQRIAETNILKPDDTNTKA